jgi:CelD/BcsL family acetyltransferase involved in cellulose biosynthesis
VRAGRCLHASRASDLGAIFRRAARALPRLQRLEVQVFDEDPARRAAIAASLISAGASHVDYPRDYTRTIALDLLEDERALLRSVHPKSRPKLRALESRGLGWTAEIRDHAYIDRLQTIYRQSFERTGAGAPSIDFRDILSDAVSGQGSVLVGAFLAGRPALNNLIAFAWGRLHGDYISYEAAGSERSLELRGASPGYAVIWHLARWARSNGASWLDLGGVIGPEAGQDDPVYGISIFKRRLSSKEFHVANEYRFEPRPALTWLGHISRRVAAKVASIESHARDHGHFASVPV